MNKHNHVTFGGPSYAVQRTATSRREGFLNEMERTLPWHRLRALVEPVYADPKARRKRPLALDRMLRIYFLQRWYKLNDTAVREAICDSNAMSAFVLVGLGSDAAPDVTAILTFRQLLEEYGLGEVIAQVVDRHLRALGLAVAPGAIVDPTVIGNHTHSQVPFARVIDTAGISAG